jgi:hypothetical protein
VRIAGRNCEGPRICFQNEYNDRRNYEAEGRKLKQLQYLRDQDARCVVRLRFEVFPGLCRMPHASHDRR